MKKHYVYGYSNEKYTLKEKYTAVFLIGMCIAAALITFLVVGISKQLNKTNTSDILIESGSKGSVEVVNSHTGDEIEKSVSKEVISEEPAMENEYTHNPQTSDLAENKEEKNEYSNAEVNNNEQDQTYIYPCQGNIIYEFSPNTPIYSPTLKDWRIHNGIDLSASLGEEVLAVRDGTVENVYEDLRYGNTIVILHGDNVKTVYSNLEDSITLKNGDKVEKGSVIARVGDTALFETIADTHLHFEIIENGSYVNPEDYLNLK